MTINPTSNHPQVAFGSTQNYTRKTALALLQGAGFRSGKGQRYAADIAGQTVNVVIPKGEATGKIGKALSRAVDSALGEVKQTKRQLNIVG